MNEKETIVPFLKQNPIGTLVTLSEDCAPCTATVYAYVDRELSLFCLTKSTTQKYKNIERNPAVALSFFNEETLATCEVRGKAYQLVTGEDVIAAVTQLQEIISKRRSGYWVPPVSQVSGSNYAAIKIVPARVVLTDYSRGAYSDEPPQRTIVEL